MSNKSDIYGFGILLLHLLTGRRPYSDEDIESGLRGNLLNWAKDSYSDCHIDTWIDSSIDMSVYEHHEILHVMNLALHCTVVDPQERPCTKNLLKALELTSSSCTTYFPKILSLTWHILALIHLPSNFIRFFLVVLFQILLVNFVGFVGCNNPTWMYHQDGFVYVIKMVLFMLSWLFADVCLLLVQSILMYKLQKGLLMYVSECVYIYIYTHGEE